MNKRPVSQGADCSPGRQVITHLPGRAESSNSAKSKMLSEFTQQASKPVEPQSKGRLPDKGGFRAECQQVQSDLGLAEEIREWEGK